MATLLTKEAARRIGALRHEDVAVPELGLDVVVRVRSLPLSLMSKLPTIEPEEQSAWLISQTAVDAEGALLYAWPDDKEFLLGMDGPGGERLAKAAFALFRVDEKKIEEARKN